MKVIKKKDRMAIWYQAWFQVFFGKEAKFREEPKGEGEKQKQTRPGCGFRLQRIYKLARATCT